MNLRDLAKAARTTQRALRGGSKELRDGVAMASDLADLFDLGSAAAGRLADNPTLGSLVGAAGAVLGRAGRKPAPAPAPAAPRTARPKPLPVTVEVIEATVDPPRRR